MSSAGLALAMAPASAAGAKAQSRGSLQTREAPTYISGEAAGFLDPTAVCPAGRRNRVNGRHRPTRATCVQTSGAFSHGSPETRAASPNELSSNSGFVAPAATNEAGDILEVEKARPANLYKEGSGGLYSDCSLTIPFVGSSYDPCGYVKIYDAARKSWETAPPVNIQSDVEYDACGTKVSSGETFNWQDAEGFARSGWFGGQVKTIPASEPTKCLGEWLMAWTFTETFSDGEKLTDSLVVPFIVTAVPIPVSATWGGGNPTEIPCTQVCSGDPVDTATGDYSESTTDLEIQGRGPGLAMQRTYSSRAAQAGKSSALGRGWTMSYGMSLSVNSKTGFATVTNENGSQTEFQPGANGYVAPPRVLATLVKNSDGTYTYTVKARTIYTFNSSGQLTGVADLNENKTTLSYNESGQLQKAADGAGRSLTFAYNESGQLATVTDSTGRKVSYGYNGSGRLVEVTDVRGGHSHYTYNEGGLLLTYKDARENTVLTNTYDSSGRVLTQTDGLEHKTTYKYSESGYTTTTEVTNPRGYITEYEYFKGALEKKIEALGTESSATWIYEHDPNTLGVVAVTDPNGHTTHATYDSHGNKTSTEDALGHKTKSVYDSLDDLTEYTDANGVTTTYTYDSRGNRLKTSTPLVGSEPAQSRVITNAYESKEHPGDVTSTTDPNGKTTTFAYDSAGDLTSATDAAGDKTTYTYDGLGRRLTKVSPRGNAKGAKASEYTTTYTYDAAGNLLTATDPLGHEQKWTYDADGNVETETDANGHATSFTYDAANRQVSVKRPNGVIERTAYDADGNVESRTNGLERTTTYAYDPLDHLASSTDPLERKTSYVYDAVGKLKSKSDPEGRTTTDTYDAANELTKVSYSDGVTPTVEYGYDPDGRLTSMTDGSGSSSFSIDSLGRLTSATDGHGDKTSYGYDLAGNETSITYPNGKKVTRSFDNAERLASVSDWLGNTTSFSYDLDSNLLVGTFPKSTGNIDEYGYDRADRMSAVTMKKGKETLVSIGYARDKAGQIESLTSKGLPGAESETFGYDANGRLTKAGSASYEYDAANNLTKAPGTTNTYDKANELETGTGVTYGYDKLGERIKSAPESGPATSYKYDQAGNLIAVERPAEGKVPAIGESYTYNGAGLRASQTVSGTKSYLTWDESGGLPLLLNDGQTSYIYGPGGLPVEQISSEKAAFYHHDQLGSTRMLTNSSGSSTGKFSYGAYGGLSGSSGEQTTPLGFAGQYTNAQSGLQYLQARGYDPVTGQFMTSDPLASDPQGHFSGSPYGYGNENPLQYVDPSGACGVGSVGEALESVNPFSEENCAYQAAKSAIDFLGGNAATIAAVSGVLAAVLAGTPAAPLAAALGVLSSAASAAGQDAGNGDGLQAALDALSSVLGGAAQAERFIGALDALAPKLAGETAAEQARDLANMLDQLGYRTLAASVFNALCLEGSG
jgi:RHS repeat-associated protein